MKRRGGGPNDREPGTVIEKATKDDAAVALQLREAGARACAIVDRTLDDRDFQARVERQPLDRGEEVDERARQRVREESRAGELVVGEQPLELRTIGDAIEDVGVRTIGLWPAGDDAAFATKRVELS